MIHYPKIETLYERDKETFKVTDVFKLPEFGLIDPKRWIFTEKIDGMNMRISPLVAGLDVRGRGDNAQIPDDLTKYIYEKLGNLSLWKDTFKFEELPQEETDITLFGEGFGAGIQKGGGYSKEKKFILFDVKVGDWWLEWDDVEDVGDKMDIPCAPAVFVKDRWEMEEAVRAGIDSIIDGASHKSEGVVARTNPTLFTRYGTRLMWKLKTKDYK